MMGTFVFEKIFDEGMDSMFETVNQGVSMSWFKAAPQISMTFASFDIGRRLGDIIVVFESSLHVRIREFIHK